MSRRLGELNRLVDRLYEDRMERNLSEDNYLRLLRKYQSEQDALLARKARLSVLRDEEKDLRTDAERFTALLQEYGDVDKLDSEILNMLIERIDVHEPVSVEGRIHQQIDITYRFVGEISFVEYGATSFYKGPKCTEASKRRVQKQRKERISAVKKEISGQSENCY